jgi:hypothetical protein
MGAYIPSVFCLLPFCDVAAEVTIIHKTIEPNLAIDSVPKVQKLKHTSHFWLQKSENPMEIYLFFKNSGEFQQLEN